MVLRGHSRLRLGSILQQPLSPDRWLNLSSECCATTVHYVPLISYQIESGVATGGRAISGTDAGLAGKDVTRGACVAQLPVPRARRENAGRDGTGAQEVSTERSIMQFAVCSEQP